MDYYNMGDVYMCDRCLVAKLRHDEYESNICKCGCDKRYCDECWRWKTLQVFKDENGNTYKIRSERIVYGKLA